MTAADDVAVTPTTRSGVAVLVAATEFEQSSWSPLKTDDVAVAVDAMTSTGALDSTTLETAFATEVNVLSTSAIAVLAAPADDRTVLVNDAMVTLDDVAALVNVFVTTTDGVAVLTDAAVLVSEANCDGVAVDVAAAMLSAVLLYARNHVGVAVAEDSTTTTDSVVVVDTPAAADSAISQ